MITPSSFPQRNLLTSENKVCLRLSFTGNKLCRPEALSAPKDPGMDFEVEFGLMDDVSVII